ncbi:MAG: hypothetical protein DMG50_16095 [Acidobacteria bacterium]|nr:MAG: hypothetical protein DMG50_16095 [Acidobacteriota bacterium]
MIVPLIMGILALAFDRQIANAMNSIAIGFDQLLPPGLKWPNTLPPRSPEHFENILFFVRWWGSVMTGIGLGLALLWGR